MTEKDKLLALFAKAAESHDPGDHEWVEILRTTRNLVAILTSIFVARENESEAKKHWQDVLSRILAKSTLDDMAFEQQRQQSTKFRKPTGNDEGGGYDA